jgi:hypothetical protein
MKKSFLLSVGSSDNKYGSSDKKLAISPKLWFPLTGVKEKRKHVPVSQEKASRLERTVGQ